MKQTAMKQTMTCTYEKIYNRFLDRHELFAGSENIVNASMVAEEIREHVKEQVEQSMEHDREASLTITVTIEEN